MKPPKFFKPPVEDPAFTSAVLTGFVVQRSAYIHLDYFDYAKANNRPYVGVWFWPVPTVRLNVGTCNRTLDGRTVERIRRLLRALENKCKHIDMGPRIVEAEGFEADRVKEVAFRLYEIAVEARPDGETEGKS